MKTAGLWLCHFLWKIFILFPVMVQNVIFEKLPVCCGDDGAKQDFKLSLPAAAVFAGKAVKKQLVLCLCLNCNIMKKAGPNAGTADRQGSCRPDGLPQKQANSWRIGERICLMERKLYSAECRLREI